MLGLTVNKKRVARLFKRKGWSCKQRFIGGRPRVQASRSVADRPDERWSTDIALVWCGQLDGDAVHEQWRKAAA